MATKYTLYLPLCVADEHGNPKNTVDVSDIYDMLMDIGGGITINEFCRGVWYHGVTDKKISELVQTVEMIVDVDSKVIDDAFRKVAERVKIKMNQLAVVYTKQEVTSVWI